MSVREEARWDDSFQLQDSGMPQRWECRDLILDVQTVLPTELLSCRMPLCLSPFCRSRTRFVLTAPLDRLSVKTCKKNMTFCSDEHNVNRIQPSNDR